MLVIVWVAMRRMVIQVTVTEKDGSADSLTHCRVRHGHDQRELLLPCPGATISDPGAGSSPEGATLVPSRDTEKAHTECEMCAG